LYTLTRKKFYQNLCLKVSILIQKISYQIKFYNKMRINLTASKLGKLIEVEEDVYIIKTLVPIGGGSGKLSHKGLRQRFLNLAKENEDEIFQVDDQTNDDMLEEEVEYLEAVRNDAVDR
jgi:hypothetical protein